MRYFRIAADHPIFARPDRVVSEIELESYKKELELAGFENIRYTEVERKNHGQYYRKEN
jgi:hypothetical protein